MQRFQLSTRVAIALLAASVLSGCYTVTTHPAPSRTVTTFGGGMVSYETPSGSFGVGIYTHPPQHPRYDGSIWYYGSHPHPANHRHGRFCSLRGSHRHEHAPHHHHRFVYYDGHYFWVGDATPYARHGESHAYQGHHPHPHYFGGYCRIRGLHQHPYAPNTASYYRLSNGAYFFNGIYGADYYAERGRYDARGWRHDHFANGYRAHEVGHDMPRAAGATGPSPPASGGTQIQRHVGQPVTTSPDASGGIGARKVTGAELMDRMRERTSAGAPANAEGD